jgi:carboxyvinyl-carboxyphosphonate phosphorylmutase
MRPEALRAQVRVILAGDRCVFPASVFDPLSARIAVDLGFETGMFAGSIAALAVLGDPDLALITLTEFADQARRICRAAPIPLLVDADHGYGNALGVRRTVIELENAGIAALTIEDTDLPRRYGIAGKSQAIPIAEACDKIAAAVDAREDPSLVIVARTSMGFSGGLEACLSRVEAFSGTAADAIFVGGVTARAELDAISARTTLPLILGGAKPETDDSAYLASRRVRYCLRGHKPFQAAVQAVYRTLSEQRDGADPAELPTGTALIQKYSGAATFDEMERRFLART